MDLSNKDKKQQRRPAVDLDTMVYGKIPPQDLEAEKAVLGALLLERHALAEVVDILKPDSFYLEKNQLIYQAILGLDTESKHVDTITVTMELRRREMLEKVGGGLYIVELTKAVVSSANITTHARIMVQMAMKRAVITAGGEMVGDGYDDSLDAFGVVDAAEARIARIMDGNERGRVSSIDTEVAKGLTRLAYLRAQESSITGIPSEFSELDRITHGWQNTDLIILAARPAVGKTAFALNLARNAALNGRRPTPVAFFTLEMSSGQLVERIISAESGIFLEKIKTGLVTEREMNHIHTAAAKIASAPIFLDDTPALNIFELRAKCRRLKRKHQIGFIIIDYLQLMSGVNQSKSGSREQEISQISRSLKGLAKELEVPIIALSQLSRAVENRSDKTPQLADLRESGAIEQDADMVMFLYRPEYYGITADENGSCTHGETHVKIAKHRNGSLDTVKLTALLHVQKFVDFQGETTPARTGSSWRPVSEIRQPFKDNELEF